MTEWGPEGKLYLNSYTCADFVFDGAELLYKLGAKFEVKTLRKNDINFYVEEPPKEVKYEESKKEIVSYFELAALRLAEMDIENFLKTLSELFVGTVYIHHDEKYYKLNLHWPNFNWKFTAQPLPPHKTTTFEQVKRNIEINK
ncbi:hypothetical protein AKO1_015419 [Acrasis kona]|uniref:Uncharacterized protein n=1 Tax=Acrasis kona TaxID=1008807 RepID=A0AAW2YKD1_9EUKA